MSKKPFHVVLTEAEREALEAIRAKMGLRSQADVVRTWIAANAPEPEPASLPDVRARAPIPPRGAKP